MAVDMNDYFNKKNGGGDKKPSGEFVPPKMPDFLSGSRMNLVYVAIAAVLVLALFRPFVIINSGETGILVTLGKYDKKPLYPGFHLFLPLMQKVIVIDTKVRIVNYTAEDSASVDKRGVAKMAPIQVLDSRGLPVEVELTIQYSLTPEKAADAIASLGLNWEEKTIQPNIRDVVRSVIGNFKAEELPTKRDEIAAHITQNMQKAIEKIKGQPIVVSSIQLRNIALPEKVKEQIERVQIANQEAERTKYEVERAKQEAQKAAEIAKGNAEAKIIEAKGQAQANELIGKSLTSNLVKMKQIEAQAKFNDALKENKDAKVFLTPNGAMPSIWMDMKEPKQGAATK
ncbi:MAG: prohibitin family protein [Campylobacterales bacterium]|nr:prohibitin family protein [Campylobacterales bacterium]